MFERSLNIKFHENPRIRILTVPCGQRMDTQTRRKSIIVAHRYFLNLPNTTHFWAYVYTKFILSVNVNNSLLICVEAF